LTHRAKHYATTSQARCCSVLGSQWLDAAFGGLLCFPSGAMRTHDG